MPSCLITLNNGKDTDAMICFYECLEALLIDQGLAQIHILTTSPYIIIHLKFEKHLTTKTKSEIKSCEVVSFLFIEDESEEVFEDHNQTQQNNKTTKARTGKQRKVSSPENIVRNEPSQSLLLSLPAELRNMIYRHVLVANGSIAVRHGQQPPPDPALLRTCTQIRKEATLIFYRLNRFHLYAQDNNVQRLVPWYKAKRKYRPNFAFTLDPTCKNWQNLLHWLELSFKGEFRGLLPVHHIDGSLKRRPANTIFRLMRAMKDAGLQWVQVAGMLEEVHLLLQLQNTGW